MGVTFPLRVCPVCRNGGPVEMVFQFRDKKRPKEYSYICCDLNTGHKSSPEEAGKAWNILARAKYDEQKEA